MNFGLAILETRKSKGLSRAMLAQKAGIASSALTAMELRGSGTVVQMEKVTQALDIRWSGLPRSKSLGSSVKQLRERKGWSQEKLCQRAGVSIPALIRVESMDRRVGVMTKGTAKKQLAKRLRRPPRQVSVQITTLSRCLEVLAPNMRVKREKASLWVYESKDSRLTPKQFLTRLRKVLGRPIDCDPCGHPAAHVKARTIYMEQDDGLTQPWHGTVFVNPPYSKMASFLRKARAEWDAGHCRCIAMLLPYRLHTFVWAETLLGVTDTFLIIGRVNFVEPNGKETSPFANALVIFGADKSMIQRALNNLYCVHLPRNARIGTGPVIKRAA